MFFCLLTKLDHFMAIEQVGCTSQMFVPLFVPD